MCVLHYILYVAYIIYIYITCTRSPNIELKCSSYIAATAHMALEFYLLLLLFFVAPFLCSFIFCCFLSLARSLSHSTPLSLALSFFISFFLFILFIVFIVWDPCTRRRWRRYRTRNSHGYGCRYFKLLPPMHCVLYLLSCIHLYARYWQSGRPHLIYRDAMSGLIT